MSVNETPPNRNNAPAGGPLRRRRGLLVGLFIALLIVGAPLALYLYLTGAADAQLREAFAETDRLDPGWRLEELEARRQVVPEQENSALLILRIRKLMAKDWGADPRLWELFDDEAPEAQLNAEQVKALRAALPKSAAALAEARKLKDLPGGRFPLTYAADWISTSRDYLSKPREVANLLENQALLQNQEGATDAALDSCRGILNCARSFGDEPSVLAALVRTSLRAVACGNIERTLAQGQPSKAALAAAQQMLIKEESQDLLLNATRGERAGMDRMMAAAQAGGIKLEELIRLNQIGNAEKPSQSRLEKGLLASGLGIKHQRAALLRHMNRVVEACKLPYPERVKRLRELEDKIVNQAALVRILVPPFSKVAYVEQRSRAQLRCTLTAIAAERYRRERGTWPGTPEALVAGGNLKAWPDDLFDGRALRLRRLKDGVVIYSVGPDGKDNGGKLRYAPDEIPEEPAGVGGLDIGFRLWDAPHRRQPPLPPRPKQPGPPNEEPAGKEP